MGVRDLNNRRIKLSPELRASVITPEGKKGNAYLIFDNYRRIMQWNRSENYALAVGILADYAVSGRPYAPLKENPAVRLKTDDVVTLQSFINRLGWSKLDEDGQLGSKTRAAVKQVQEKAGLPQDGYPDYLLLKKIRNYDPEIGFAVPVPPRKLHKGN